jgi:methyl-accepting chemotaxis protein-2 (aspartate sensor receptor)
VHKHGQGLQRVDNGDKPYLLLAGSRVEDRLDLVDNFTAQTGAAATIFLRQGDDFIRITTSLKNDDGSRPSGTALGPQHPARQPLLAGKSFIGKATILGKNYMTYYAPALDAEKKVIGAFFIGIELTETIKALKKSLLAYKIGDSGYVFAVDAGQNLGNIVLHPSLEGKNSLDFKDSKGFAFIREMLDKKSGFFFYDWANPGETRMRQKAIVFEHFPEWDWVVGATCYIDDFNKTADIVAHSLLIMAVAVLAVAIGSCFLMTRRWISRPLQQLIGDADRIAAGDLQSTIPAGNADEVGRLRRAVAQMAGNLKSTIGEVRQTSGRVIEHVNALVNSAESVSQGSENQRESVTSMAASVEEMSVSIDQVAQHARDASQLTDRSGKTASDGEAVVQQAVVAMNRITDFVRQASQTITDLGQRSQDISAVVQVIREIADQTNLLALNAAIEAARAGEQGRGFAVVADEVRKLAERTAKSTQSIGEMISHIQEGADAAVRQMAEGVATVETGSTLANQAGEAINSIEKGTREVAGAVDVIANAASEQSAASQTLAVGIERISQMADANHLAARQTAESAQALRHLATQLDQSLARFST